MQLNPASLLLLRKISAKKRAENRSSVAVNHQGPETSSASNSASSSLSGSTANSTVNSAVKSRKERFQNWMSPKPQTIQAYPGEEEIFRKGLILVTDTRLAYIDPFDRMLKTYMFEHMISVHKQFYQTTAFNRFLCKGLLILCILVFFVILTIDLLDTGSRGVFLAYIPLFASILLGLNVWNDMKPTYVIHWRMRDHTYEEIAQEPLFSERLKGDTKRELFMNELVGAMNQALSAKAWCPPQMHHSSDNNTIHADNKPEPSDSNKSSSAKLKLVTNSYQ